MRTISKGRYQKGWALEAKCTGMAFGGGGCESKLLVEQADVYMRLSGETAGDVWTFTCPECGVQTSLKTIPQSPVPHYAEWLVKQDKKKQRDEMIEQTAKNIILTIKENLIAYDGRPETEQEDHLRCDINNAITGLFERYDHS